MVLLEAMAAKVPVIATKHGGPLEIFDGGDCGALVPPEDAEAIARECRRYLDDVEYRRRIADKAYERLCKTFDIRMTVERVGKLIETTCRSHYAGEFE
jgi:glycosyltransferase involved in cell wall biosynthesis